ncbi:hypothetical protein [Luteococcus peritonei]|uniref:Sugar ABC transporter ATPase n=1 Tax=Luteococcus peritonei TaxID=88874 RepID=A0ABW4RU85_9ACTN
MSIEHNDATELSDETGEIDQLDSDLDGVEDTDELTEMADANRPYGEVTAEDLGTQDLIDDGGDLATTLDDDARTDNRAAGVVPVDEEMTFDDLTTEETLEDRFQQEEPDPISDIVPPDAGRRA